MRLEACGGLPHLLTTLVGSWAVLTGGGSPPQQVVAEWHGEMTLKIGLDAKPGHDFISPTVNGVDQDGRIYVYDRRLDELRRFDTEGRFLDVVARRGDGPGDLRPGIFLRVDSTYIWYSDQRGRVQWITLDGRPLRTVSTGITAGGLGVAALTILNLPDDSTVLVMAGERTQPPRDGQRIQFTNRYQLVTIGGHHRRTLFEFQWLGAISLDGGRTRISFPGPYEGPAVIPRPHQGRLRFLSVENLRAHRGEAPLIRLRLTEESGTVIRERDLALEPVPFSPALRDSLRTRLLNSASFGGRRNLEPTTLRHLREIANSWPEYLPAFEQASAGPDGLLFLKRPASNPTEPREWLVVDSLFNPVARAYLPPAVERLSFIGNQFWATAIDELDVRFVARVRFEERLLRGPDCVDVGRVPGWLSSRSSAFRPLRFRSTTAAVPIRQRRIESNDCSSSTR